MQNNRGGFGRIGALLVSVGLIISIVMVTLLVFDLRQIQIIWRGLRWHILLCLIPLALVNHAVRYWRWELLLKKVSEISFRRSTSILLFSVGSLLIFTPARVGEIAKSVYARNFFNIPVATSLPILIIERLADVVVMAILAGIGILLLGETANLLLASLILGATLIVLIAGKPLLNWGTKRMIARMREGSKLEQTLTLANQSQNRLLMPRTLGITVSLGFTAWMLEVIIYFLSLNAVGIPIDIHLFILALAVFPLASLGGSISFLPGGLGVTESGLAALTVIWGGFSVQAAVLAALLTRAAILGVVVLAGVVALLIMRLGQQHRLT